MADNTTELEVLDQIVEVLGGQSGQYETVVPTLQQILALLGGGGGGGGYNPSLSVGRADALTGADSTAQWATRESTGSGAATVRSVQGAAVVFNQLNNNSGNTDTKDGITFTKNSDGSWTASGTSTSTSTVLFSIFSLSRTSGHKYLVRGCPAGGSANTYYLGFSGNVTDTGNGGIYTAVADTLAYLYLIIGAGATIDNLTFWPQCFDLTQMFGAGNEPQSVAEFEAMYPESYYPYSAPTLKPVQIAGIQSKDAQGGELDAIEWTAQTLRAAGTIRDELTAGELVTRVGAADASNAWVASVTTVNEHGIGYVSLTVDVTGPSFIDGLSSNLPISTGSFANSTQREFACNAATNMLYYRFPTTEPVTLENALADMRANNAECFYPLATPTTTPISPALPMTYKVQQGGTESIIVPNGEISAAPIITAAEGESAADVVMDALACIAAPDGPVATANHAINTYLTMQGKLYKVTSAIAVGETIKSGTNVSQTTVMAELIARTA